MKTCQECNLCDCQPCHVPVEVGIDDVGPFKAMWDQVTTWNGWLCVFFSKEEAEKALKAFGNPFHWEGEILRYDNGWDNEAVPVEAVVINGQTVYPLGFQEWCWETWSE